MNSQNLIFPVRLKQSNNKLHFIVSGASNLEELQQKLSDMLMIRRHKNEVLTQLPPKQRQRVLFELKDSDIKKVGIVVRQWIGCLLSKPRLSV